MTTFAVQYLESCPELGDYAPEEVQHKLRAACEILPISIIILGWSIPQRLIEVCGKEAQRVNAKLYRWQPLLTSDGEFPVITDYQVIGLSGRRVAGHFNMPEFTFMCPNNPDLNGDLLAHLEKILKLGIYDGIFLDRMRFPALSNDPENNLSCFCPHCQAQAKGKGLDLLNIQDQIKQMLTTSEGILRFIEVIFGSGKSEDSTPQQLALRNFLDFRADSITRIVRQTEQLTHGYGWRVGLDCFSPTLAYSAGQDLAALDSIGDWIKIMTYLHTFAPAGLPFELNGMLEFIKRKKALDVDSIIDWLSQITHLPIPKDQEIMIRDGLPASALEKELSKAKKYVSKKLFAGIELVAIKNITNINPLQLEKDMQTFKKTGADGIVLSWDLWHIQEESLRVLKGTLLSV